MHFFGSFCYGGDIKVFVTITPNRAASDHIQYTKLATNLQYSQISLNIENLGNYEGILCNISDKL